MNLESGALKSYLKVKDGQKVKKGDILCNWDPYNAVILSEINGKKKNYGFDVKNEKFGDLFALGVIDPLKVTKNALINAVSVATTILSTNAIVTLARTYDNK